MKTAGFTRLLPAVALLALPLLNTPASANAYNSGWDTGNTAITSTFDGSTYTWTLTNTSDTVSSNFDVLIWSLIPYNVLQPLSTTAPAGWSFGSTSGSQGFSFDENQKYFTPPAIGPGQSAVFTYTIDP